MQIRRRITKSVWIAAGAGFFVALIVLPFLQPLSLELSDWAFIVHGEIAHFDRDAQGLRRTEATVWAMSGPLKRKRYSLAVGSIAMHLDVVRDLRPEDYSHDD